MPRTVVRKNLKLPRAWKSVANDSESTQHESTEESSKNADDEASNRLPKQKKVLNAEPNKVRLRSQSVTIDSSTRADRNKDKESTGSALSKKNSEASNRSSRPKQVKNAEPCKLRLRTQSVTIDSSTIADRNNYKDFTGSALSKKNDEVTKRSLRPKKVKNAEQEKPSLRSQSASKDSSTITDPNFNCDRNISSHTSRSQNRMLRKHPKAASVDRSVNIPITSKIQADATTSFLRYLRVGESAISLAGSPVVTNGGAMDGTANITIPVADNVLVIQPVKMRKVDSRMVSSIDNNTKNELKQLQDNLSTIISTVDSFRK